MFATMGHADARFVCISIPHELLHGGFSNEHKFVSAQTLCPKHSLSKLWTLCVKITEGNIVGSRITSNCWFYIINVISTDAVPNE